MKEENGDDIPFNNQNLKDMMEDAYWLELFQMLTPNL